MGLSLFESVHWAATVLIEVVVLTFALRRKLFDQLPVFTIYLCILVANEAIVSLTYSFAGIRSHTSFYVYWAMQAVQVSIRAIVVYEICQALLSRYTGIWKLCRPLLITLGLVLAGSAAATSRQRVHPISATTLMAERGLEFTVVSILIFGLIFCRYYGVWIDRHLAWIALGLGFYSAVQVANNTFLRGEPMTHLPVLQIIRQTSFNIATIFWLVALWKPLPARQPAPVLLGPGEYDRLAPQMTLRLRELNSRLLEMWK
ncbi:MAG TPA: hypothetical protein VKT50_11660 [Candidatus Acidoferrales bacterium]|nr:hypothetical protein [Candidatus Acidoferrales bacterium]